VAGNHRIGSLLLGYYRPEGQLLCACRAGTGMPEAELERLWHRLRPLAVEKMSMTEPPPRGSRFGSPLMLSRVHWVHPEMIVDQPQSRLKPQGEEPAIPFADLASVQSPWESHGAPERGTSE
jgi:hypothetical protein